MALENGASDSVLPINCAGLSLSSLKIESGLLPVKDQVPQNDINGEPSLPIPQGNDKISSKKKRKLKKLQVMDSSSGTTPEVNVNDGKSKRRISLASQNPPNKVHKRKQNWESGKLSVLYSDDANSGFTLSSLQSFILDVLKSKSYSSNDIFKAELYGKVKNMTVVFVSGIEESDLQLAPVTKNKHLWTLSRPEQPSLPFIYDKFQYAIPMTLPANKEVLVSPIFALLRMSLSNKEKLRRAAKNKQQKLVLFDLLLTETEMRDNNYPIHSLIDGSDGNALPTGWVETKPFDHDGSHTFAVDCEFCDAASGKVLTRISIVNFQSEVVYDTYVKPDEEITNYQTRYSGITEKTLEGVTTTLEDVQKKVLSMVSSSDILIGHSLESDLNVMHMRHPRIIDTALTYEHHKGFPQKPGLRSLSEQYLKRLIQQGEATGNGHSSIEDLIASLDLVKLKLLSGPDFGRNVDTILFSEGLKDKSGVRARVIDSGVKVYNNLLKNCDVVDIASTSNDEEALEVFKAGVSDYFFNLVWLRELRRGTTSSNKAPGTTDAHTENEIGELTDTSEVRKSLLSKSDTNLQQIYDSLPSGSIFVVCSDGGSLEEIKWLQNVRYKFHKQIRAGIEVSDMTGEMWDTEKKDMLRLAVQEARKAIALITIKE